jgi:shikimate 5-dehydrogenase
MPIDGRTRVAFVLGHPVEHSLSPAMHQAAFRAVGLNAAYLPWSVPPARLLDEVRGLRAMENLLGANVTVPHKPAVVPLMDRLTPEAEALGAVNTTSLGLRVTDPSLIEEAGLPPSTAVVDLIYRPAETPLLAAARRRDCRAVNGLGMLLHQGAPAFERWTGRPAPLDVMRTALERSV